MGFARLPGVRIVIGQSIFIDFANNGFAGNDLRTVVPERDVVAKINRLGCRRRRVAVAISGIGARRQLNQTCRKFCNVADISAAIIGIGNALIDSVKLGERHNARGRVHAQREDRISGGNAAFRRCRRAGDHAVVLVQPDRLIAGCQVRVRAFADFQMQCVADHRLARTVRAIDVLVADRKRTGEAHRCNRRRQVTIAVAL